MSGELAPGLWGIPVVSGSSERAALFPTPTTNQRVQNTASGNVERWNGTAWVVDSLSGSVVYAKSAPYNVLDDGTDQATNLQSALTAASGKLLSFAGLGTVLFNSAVTPPDNIEIDLSGATLKPNGNSLGLSKQSPAATATTTISSGATLGSRTVVVASAAGIVIGQWYRLSADNTGPEDTGSYPSMWGKIINVVGTTITLDEPLPCTFNGTVSFNTFNSIYGKFSIRRGKIDGSTNTHNANTGQGLRLAGYESVEIDIEVTGFANGGTLTCPIQVLQCVDAKVKGRIVDGVSQYNMIDVQDCRSGVVEDCFISGDHFGVNITRCAVGRAINNTLFGRRKKNADESVSPVRSVRGIKITGCSHASLVGNHSYDFESPYKIDASDRFLVANNFAVNAGLSAFSGQVALNIGSVTPFSRLGEGSVIGNVVENAGGNAIGVVGDTKGRVVIAGNIVRKCYGHGIYSDAPHVIVMGNQIIDFATEGTTTYSAIALAHATGRHIVDNNACHNDVTTTPFCLAIASPNAMIGKNTVSTANKLTSLFGAGPFSGDVGAAAYMAATVANVTGDGTLYTVLLDTEFHDNGDCYDPATGKFKALLPGLYTFSANIYSNGIGGAATLAKLEITHFNSGGGALGTRDYQINPQGILAGGQTSLTISGSFKMAAGDYLQVRVAYSNATKVIGVVGQAGATNPQFTHGNFARVAA